METVKPRWLLRKKWEEEECEILARRWKLHPLIIKLLLNRGVGEDSFQHHLSPSFDALHDPFSMAGMREAVDRLLLSIARREKILIYGDFDVDGITATSLLLRLMRDLKFSCYYYIPDRQSEGYGLNREAIRKVATKDIKLIITCDCGTSSVEEIRYARSLGVDVIVTDHHQVEDPLPPDLIILNPHKPGCDYPFKDLSGVGVAFKLCQALSQKSNASTERLKSHLYLVAMGTLADMVSLSGENRILVKLGLKRFSSDPTSLGLRALINVSGLSAQKIEEREVGYILGPRLNACGRLSLAKTAVKLLLTESPEEALLLAHRLNAENIRRQNLEKKMCKEAEEILTKELKLVLVVGKGSWHSGVIGLVASYLRDRYRRPALAFSIEKETARGSARSTPNFSIFEALTKCSDLITNFGGHEMAAGLTLPAHNIKELEDRLNELAGGVLSPDDFVPCRFFDAEVGLENLDMGLVKELQILSPFGVGNPKPIFLAKDVRIIHSRTINKGKKLILSDFAGTKEFEALSFNSYENEGDHLVSKGIIDVLYFPTVNNWRGKQTVQMEIKGVKETGG